MENRRGPVRDWATDYDVLDDGFALDPFSVFAELRERCPVATTERWGGSAMPVTYELVTRVAREPEVFSSSEASVMPRGKTSVSLLPGGLPPIEADPPFHTASRRLILPWFSPTRVDSYEPYTRMTCRELLDTFRRDGSADAAEQYARQIPVRVIATMLGISPDMADTFTEWVLSTISAPPGDPRRDEALLEMYQFFVGEIAKRQDEPGDDLISEVLRSEIDGRPLGHDDAMGMVILLLAAGVDTTWSSIGASLWHLATHPEHRRRLVAEPGLMSTGIEELLRVYGPVTMARIATHDSEIGGCPVSAGTRVLLSFPAANHDPAVFPDPDEVVLDRQHNRHVAFGAGIHRCAGSNLARMELRVALEEWIAAIPEFELAPDAHVPWSSGQVRGPRAVPVVFPVATSGDRS